MSQGNNSVHDATYRLANRVMSRIVGFQQGHNVILNAILAAHMGHENLSDAFSRLDKSLVSSGIDSQDYFLSLLFLDSISEVEIFLSGLVKAVISQYPRKLGNTKFSLVEIMDAKNIDELTTKAADEFVNKLMYKKPLEYLDSICELLSIDKAPLTQRWSSYIEAKARRDLGVHNGWVCNQTYLKKMQEAGIDTNAEEGTLMIPNSTDYTDPLGDDLIEIVSNISEQVMRKYK